MKRKAQRKKGNDNKKERPKTLATTMAITQAAGGQLAAGGRTGRTGRKGRALWADFIQSKVAPINVNLEAAPKSCLIASSNQLLIDSGFGLICRHISIKSYHSSIL